MPGSSAPGPAPSSAAGAVRVSPVRRRSTSTGRGTTSGAPVVTVPPDGAPTGPGHPVQGDGPHGGRRPPRRRAGGGRGGWGRPHRPLHGRAGADPARGGAAPRRHGPRHVAPPGPGPRVG